VAAIQKQTGYFLDDFAPGTRQPSEAREDRHDGLLAIFTDFPFTTSPLATNRRYAPASDLRDLVAPRACHPGPVP
jgi:hypothetical protein